LLIAHCSISAIHTYRTDNKQRTITITITIMTTPVLKIKYWKILGRASGLFRMCLEAGVDFEHTTEAADMGCAFFGAETGNLAPPVIEDGTIVISQAVACHQYLGNKFGFNKNIEVPELAVQFISDLSDLHREMGEKAAAGADSNDVKVLQEYLTGDRYKNHLRAIERCIQGPFFFGEEMTYVDFATASFFDMADGKWLTPLLEKSGDTVKEHAPKLKAVLDHIRGLPSADDPRITEAHLVPPPFVLKPDRVATWT
jgi:glutathione S-transferase